MYSSLLLFFILSLFSPPLFGYPIGSGGCFDASTASINDDFKAFTASHGLQSTSTASNYRILSSSPLQLNDEFSPSKITPTASYSVQWDGRCPLRVSICSTTSNFDDSIGYRGILLSSTTPIVTADRNLRPLPCHSSSSAHPSSSSSGHHGGEGGSGMEKSGGVAWTRGRASYSGSGGAPAIATSADGLPLPTFAFTHFNSHIKQTPIDFTVQSVPKNADNQTIVIIVLDGKKGQWAYWSIKTVLPSSSVSDGTPCPSVTESLCPLSSKHSESLSTSDGGALKLILYNRNNDGKMKSDGMGDMDMDMDHSMHHSSSNDDNKKSDGMMENCPDCAKKADSSNNAAAPAAAAAPKGGCPHCAASAAAKAAAASPSPAPKGGCPHCAHQASSESSDASSGHSAHGGVGGCPHCSKSSSSSSSDSGMSMEGMSMGGGMTMVFTSNWRGNELLFPGWRTDTLSQYIIQLIIVFLFAFVFEFLQSFQADWDVKTAIKNAKSAHHYTAIGAIGDDDDEKLGGSLNGNPVTNELVWVPYEWGQQLFRAIIYGIRVFLSLLIMMVFMVMDFYLVTAIMLGYITGFLIFSRHRVAPQKTACH